MGLCPVFHCGAFYSLPAFCGNHGMLQDGSVKSQDTHDNDVVLYEVCRRSVCPADCLCLGT